MIIRLPAGVEYEGAQLQGFQLSNVRYIAPKDGRPRKLLLPQGVSMTTTGGIALNKIIFQPETLCVPEERYAEDFEANVMINAFIGRPYRGRAQLILKAVQIIQ
jgi:hypothetical protein